jgi:hypothetical protein
MSDWDEIRRLAADLQRAQLGGSIQKLSERNCIEIVSRLVGLNALEVLYTADGKEYLTPQQLQREIRDELHVARGRISLVDLAQICNVDFSHVEHQAQMLAKQDSRVNFVLGQLVDASYLDFIAEEINEKLQLDGTVSISTITKEYDLPSEFLQEEIVARLGSIIEGFRDEHDPKVILTPSYVQRNKAKIRGALSAVTVPTAVSNIVSKFGIPEQIFFGLADDLIKSNRLSGQITGGKKAAKATYVPSSYARAQARWVDDFLRQNGYLEYDALTRFGVSDPKQFIRKRFDGLTFLSSCAVGQQICDQIETSLEDALATGSWTDIAPLIPSVLSREDGKILLESALKTKNVMRNCHIFADTVLLTQPLLEKVEKSFVELMSDQAKKDLESKKYDKIFASGRGSERLDMTDDVLDRKDERRKKAASGKAGGGAQGRETKTKSTKKKYGKASKKDDWSDDSGDDDDNPRGGGGGVASSKMRVEFMSRAELEDKLSSVSTLQECPEEMFAELAQHFYPSLTTKFKSLLSELYQSSLLANVHDKRKAHSELQDKCNSAVSMIRLFEKGTALFDAGEKKNLEKHLFRTLCSDLLNLVFVHVRNEHGLNKSSASLDLNQEQRVKVLSDLPKEIAEPLLAMHKTLVGGESVTKFLDVFEQNCDRAVDLFIKKSDTKKSRALIFGHRQTLSEQLAVCNDPALALHCALLILFTVFNNAILHASGKFVPAILDKIVSAKVLKPEDQELLQSFQNKVLESLNRNESAKEELQEMMPKLKELAVNARRSGAKAEEQDQ